MIANVPLRDICKGRWQSILPLCGIDSRHLTGKHGPCPLCGGTDRFRFDDKEGRGSWICSKCGAGDGIALAMLVNSWDFKEAASRIQELAGSAPRTVTRRERSEQSLKDAMNRLWRSGLPVKYGDTVSRYLERRGIHLDTFPLALRYVEKCRYQGDEPRWFPTMLAKITGPDGTPVNLHRTYLTDDGRKADVDAPRRIMPGRIGKGCAIRLCDVAPTMGIAEGVETAMSAAIIWRVPCWAAVSAAMLMAWEPPAEAKEIIVFADNDKGFAGQSAAYTLAHRLAAKGTHVRVEMPPDEGMDWNDVLIAEKQAA